MDNQLQTLLGKQYLITAYIEPRLQIVNFIMDGYNNNVPVLMNNRFLHFTAHNYYRSIIVDLATLFSENKNTHKYNFHTIVQSGVAINSLKPAAVVDIQTWLSESQGSIHMIKRLRDKEIAHFDFEQGESISMNFDNIQIINDLFELAKKIIIYTGSSFLNEELSIGYDFESRSHYIDSLKRLIKLG